MKKILIFYASYGGGHLSAAKSISQYLEEHYSDIEIKMVDCVEYVNKALNKLTTAAYREMAKKAPWAWEKVYYKSQDGALAKVSTFSNRVMAIKMDKLFKSYMPDIVISTHPFGSQITSYLKKKNRTSCKLATILTDFAIHEQWLVGSENVDFFFVSNDKMKQDIESEGVDSNKIFVTGIPISKRFSINFDSLEILNQLDFVPDKKTILFFGGGEFGLGKDKTVAILKALADNRFDVQVIAIAGKNEKMKDAFTKVVAETHSENRIRVLPFTNQVPEFMHISDLVITKPGGLTTSESLASFLPIIVINPLPGQEEENAMFLEKNGAGIWLKHTDNPYDILSDILNNDEKLTYMKQKSKQISKPFASKDICEIIMK